MTAVFVNSHIDIGEFLLHLIRLVANVAHRSVGGGKHISLALALVSAA